MRGGSSPLDELPLELEEQILARCHADIPSLLSLRLVSKAWNSLLHSPSFALLHQQLSPPLPLLLTFEGINPSTQKLFLCTPSMHSWLHPPLPSPQHALVCDFQTSVSSGGLICCVATPTPTAHKFILLFNPFVKSSKLLPPPSFFPECSPPLPTLAVWRDSSTNNYKVAVSNTKQQQLQVYDSRTGNWHSGSEPPLSGAGMTPRLEGYLNNTKDTMLWYDMEGDIWMESSVPETSPLHLTSPTIIRGRRGQLRLAAVITPTDSPTASIAQGFGVWELQGDVWVEISRTPQSMWPQSTRILHTLPESKLLVSEDLVCMSHITRPSPSPFGSFYPWLLLYHLSHDKWEWSPQIMDGQPWSNYSSIAILQPNFQALPI